MTLLSAQTNAEITIRKASDDVHVYKGDKIPFDGVLVPEYNYKQFIKASEVEPVCEKTLMDSSMSCDHTVTDDIIVFGFGLLGGGLLYGIFRK